MSRSQIVLLVAILNTIIEVILQVLLIVIIISVCSNDVLIMIRLSKGNNIDRLLLLLLSLNGLANSCNLTEFGIVNHAVSIVIAASQNRFDVFSAREETVLLKESDQVWHTYSVVSF